MFLSFTKCSFSPALYNYFINIFKDLNFVFMFTKSNNRRF